MRFRLRASVETTVRCGTLVAILALTSACDSTGPEPQQGAEVPEVPQVPEIMPIVRGQIVFVDQTASSFQIFVADSNGSRLKNLSLGASHFDPDVSTDGKRIAFSASVQSEWGPDIWVMNADGTNRVRLTHTAKGNASSRTPAWSPDGKRVAFVTTVGVWENQIFVMNADGTDVHPVTEAAGDSRAPEWSPDGSRILFARLSGKSESMGIFAMNPDGSNVRQLTSDPGDKPTWSPDGTRIAFIGGQNLIVMNSDGSNARSLTSGVHWEGDLTWSPDGRSIVYGVASASKTCLDWNDREYACGRDLRRVDLDGAIQPTWVVTSAFSAKWQR
jgi:Tol biopolymer transport system component